MKLIFPVFFTMMILTCGVVAQPVTGVWRGKIKVKGKRVYQVELKMIRNADSLTGSSYYYYSTNQYSRYLIKGYFAPTGEIVWWDDQLIEKKGQGTPSGDQSSMIFSADFNCPGGDIMKLDGTSDDNEVHLDKMKKPVFPDEWDDVIENFPYYVFTPGLIDSVAESTMARSDVPEMSNPTRSEVLKPNPLPIVVSVPPLGDGTPFTPPCMTRTSRLESMPKSVVTAAPSKLLV